MADTLISGTTLIEDKRSEKGEVWSCSCHNFVASRPDSDGISYDDNRNQVNLDAGTATQLTAPVFLPNGATITGVIVYGSDAVETWTLFRDKISLGTAADTIASAVLGTEDTTISNPVVNNNDYCYWLMTSALDDADTIYGARINYEF